jgi:hypothetical protein
MKRLNWIGWLLAGLLLVQTAGQGLAASSNTSPLEGRLLHHSNGSFYVYHDGMKFAVQEVNMGDQVIDAIPGASEAQWDSLFTQMPAAPNQPPALPTYCGWCYS